MTAIKGELSWIDAPDTVASVYAYAVGQMPPPPGANPAAVTDAFLRYALADVQP